MFGKELKYRIYSIVFLIVSAGILLMVYTNFVPEKWYLYAEPLTLQKYVYIELKTAYEKERIGLFQLVGSLPERVEVSLDQEDQEQILNMLKQMNPKETKQEELSKLQIGLSEEEVRDMVRQFELSLDGVLAEDRSYMEEEYEFYLQLRNNACTNPTPEEQMEQMEESLFSALNYGQYYVFQWGIGPDYQMFFGNVKNVDFTREQVEEIWKKWQEMRNKRETFESTRGLRYYQKCLDEIDDLLGGNTMFAEENRFYISNRLNTWEEEQMVFEEVLQKDSYTRAYARYLCDYLGIVAGILPVLYAAFLFSRDRRSKIQEFIMVSPQKSSRIVGTRILSILVIFLAWFYLLAALVTGYFAYIGGRFGYSMDLLAFFKYVTIWIVPTVCFSVSLSVFLDLLFQKSMLVVLVQLLLFFVSIENLVGKYTLWKPIIRYNVIGNYAYYEKSQEMILANRGCIFLLSLILFGGSIFLYERKRQGKSLFVIGALFQPVSKKMPHKAAVKTSKTHSWLYYQMKQTFSKNILFALLFVCFISVMMQGFVRDLEQIKRIGENYLTLSSIFLFVPLCNMEKASNVYEVMCVQRKAYGSIYLLRVCAACLLQGFVLAVPLAFFIVRFDYKFGWWFLGIYVSALFLGLLGLIAGEKTRSRRIGIAVILGYYLLCVSLKDTFRWLTICGYTYQIPKSKGYLSIGCVLEMALLIGLLLYRSYAKRRKLV